jgi:hypothetical protein
MEFAADVDDGKENAGEVVVVVFQKAGIVMTLRMAWFSVDLLQLSVLLILTTTFGFFAT